MGEEPEARIANVELRHIRLPMKHVFRSAIGVRDVKDALIVGVVGDDGTVGYGECSARTDPYYSYEYLDSVWITLQQFFSNEVFGLTFSEALSSLERSRIRGWPFARAALEEAVFDWRSRAVDGMGEPAAVLHLNVGATLSTPTDADLLGEEAMRHFDAGYRRVRIKGKVDMDWQSTLNVLSNISRDKRYIAIDFNGCLDPASSRSNEILEQVSGAVDPAFAFVEQPYPPDSLLPNAQLRKRGYPIPISLDESISTMDTLQLAAELGAIDICNIKPGRVGGPTRVVAMARWCLDHNVSAHLGGMFETGVGRWSNARLAATLLPDSCHDLTLPDDYLVRDVVHEKLTLNKATGSVSVENRPAMVDAAAMLDATMRVWSLS